MTYVTSSSFGNWLPSILGGSCLGVASVVVLAQTGRVLGISGIVGCAAYLCLMHARTDGPVI